MIRILNAEGQRTQGDGSAVNPVSIKEGNQGGE